MFELALLFFAGVLGGVMNAVAGGGTFVTFPALVFAGLPPVAANATSTAAALPGYLAAAIGFRREIAAIEGVPLKFLTLWAAIGGAVGSLLLLISSDRAFSALVPILLLIATGVFYWSEPLRHFASRWRSGVAPFSLATLLPVAIYGGYFNGGLGIILLALFALWGMTDLHQMNGLKSWLSFALSAVSVLVLAMASKIVWGPAAIVAAGTIIGGYTGAPVARHIPKRILRLLIVAVGLVMAVIFFKRLINGV